MEFTLARESGWMSMGMYAQPAVAVDERQITRRIAAGDREALGVAFMYQAEHDAGYEIILSTPTSIRIVMICRMVLVVGYNMVLAAVTSAIIAITLGGTLWDFMHLWLGPMLLLASISLTVSVIFGSVVSVGISLLLEVMQAIATSFEKAIPLIHFLRANLLQTTPTAFFIALLLIVFAVYYAPRQPRLSNS